MRTMKRRLVCVALISRDPYGDILDIFEIDPRAYSVRRAKKAMHGGGAFQIERINVVELIKDSQ